MSQRWRYHSTKIKYDRDENEADDHLSRLGRDGWEMVSAVEWHNDYILFFFKRQITGYARMALDMTEGYNEDDILPCPFCGQPPMVEQTGFHLSGRTIRDSGRGNEKEIARLIRNFNSEAK